MPARGSRSLVVLVASACLSFISGRSHGHAPTPFMRVHVEVAAPAQCKQPSEATRRTVERLAEMLEASEYHLSCGNVRPPMEIISCSVKSMERLAEFQSQLAASSLRKPIIVTTRTDLE